MSFRIAYADITQLKADAIVNPTDQYYSGGGGVDWLLNTICGPELRKATRKLPRLHLGEAKATPGFNLPCKYIIHTSGPRWRNSHFLEISLLGSCYRNCIQLAYNLGCRSIAFPLVSSRGKHFPKEQALTTAINAIMESMDEYPDMEIILTIYGKWTETMPVDFFNSLTDYVNDMYEPEDFSEPAPTLRVMREEVHEVRDDTVWCEAAPIDGNLIRDLIDKPTQKNLDKFQVDEPFSEMLCRLIAKNNAKTKDITNEIGISSPALSKLKKGTNNPAKMTVFAFAIFFKLSIEETEEMLMKAGYAINPSSIQDIVVSSLIREGIYDRSIIDELLDDLDLQPLYGENGKKRH